MPTLSASLQDRDLGFLFIVAERWGVELSAPDARIGLQNLTSFLLDHYLVSEVVDALPAEAHSALHALQSADGKIPWAAFVRRFGNVRQMGPARRDRLRPDRDPISTAEVLWYTALVSRAFFDAPEGPQEFAYIPEDLLALLPFTAEHSSDAPLGRPATSAERAVVRQTSDRILDDLTTLLAAQRIGLPLEEIHDRQEWALAPRALKALAVTAGLLDKQGVPNPETVRIFLESSRGGALQWLVEQWQQSAAFDEVRLLPGIRAEGVWSNAPLRTRQAVLNLLLNLPIAAWWSIDALVQAVKSRLPDFQRSGGEYEAWYLRDLASGEYLHGFAQWDAVEGALLRWMLGQLLPALGLLDVAFPEGGSAAPSAFRRSKWFPDFGEPTQPLKLAEENQLLHVRSDGRVEAPRLAPRAARYQIARFCEWLQPTPGEYRYQLTPPALARARAQGLRSGHLLSILRKYARTVPPNIVKALTSWEEGGEAGKIEPLTVLRLRSPQILQALQQSRAARFLGDPLGTTAVIVKPGAADRVRAVLLELGYLVE